MILIISGSGASIHLKQSKICIGSSEYQNISRCSGRWYAWPTVAANFSKYFLAHISVWFLPGVYNLSSHFPIVNVVNLTLNGIKTDKVAVTINCTNTDSFLSIYNSSSLKIRNIAITNCGASMIKFYDLLFPNSTSAAFLVYNVHSVTISDVVLRNSHGHGVIGYDLAGKIVLDGIKISEDRKVNTTYITGGFLIVFTDKQRNSNIQRALIRNLQISHICSSLLSDYKSKNQQTDAVAIGIGLYQSKYSVSIHIHNSAVTNVTSFKGSHGFITHTPHVQNTVVFRNFSFTNNTNHQDLSLYKVRILKIRDDLKKINLMVILYSCTISHNVMNFWQPLEHFDKFLFLNLTITLTEFSYNKMSSTARGMKFDKLVETNIKQCRFLSNAINIEFNGIAKLVISGYNVFQNNTANRFLMSTIKCYDVTFDGYNEFSHNTANPILLLYKSVTLKEGTEINITYNNAFSDDLIKVKKRIEGI